MTAPLHPPVLSPCTGVCVLGRDGYCDGCLRSGDEIARWIAMDDAQRRELMEHALPLRESLRTCG
ncbi:MAG: DUF1289 domain-containing protein [Dokdonella sp.]|uniref:DUF1289 domain-containing protein n=1 Tax=Dokdonella sp. TaxID=2291710 RepID=UPI003263DBFA